MTFTVNINENNAAILATRHAREKLAAWMIAYGFATGHGDTMDDLLAELSEQIKPEFVYRECIRIAVTKLHCMKDKLSMRRLMQIEDIIATLEGTSK